MEDNKEKMVQHFVLTDLVEQQRQSGRLYLEFLKVESMSMGVYCLPAGGTDPQKPHTEDEVYYVAAGRGSIQVGEEDLEVGPGAVVFVPASVEHRFHNILEDLTVLVVFAPAEYSRSTGAPQQGQG